MPVLSSFWENCWPFAGESTKDDVVLISAAAGEPPVGSSSIFWYAWVSVECSCTQKAAHHGTTLCRAASNMHHLHVSYTIRLYHSTGRSAPIRWPEGSGEEIRRHSCSSAILD